MASILYYCLVVVRNKGKIIDKFYRKTRSEIIDLKKSIEYLYKNCSTSLYIVDPLQERHYSQPF